MRAFNHPCGGIDWYCEQRGQGPSVVLVPSGEGDCASFDATAAALADSFTVLTFDMPGFSRTSKPRSDADISPYKIGEQVAELVSSLGITKATFYGCSSAGIAVLDLVQRFPEAVHRAVVHEVAVVESEEDFRASPLYGLLSLDDDGIASACAHFYGNVFNEDLDAWESLGPEYHARLRQNYVTWVRQYVAKMDAARTHHIGSLRKAPLVWTVGGLSPTARTFANIRLSYKAGIEPHLLPCRHFPQVSIPVVLADHIRRVAS